MDQSSLFSIDLMLPEQWSQDRHVSPERKLILANLENAVRAFLLHSRFASTHGRQILAELELWFTSPDDFRPFAFRTACEIFGLDADGMWVKLKQMRDQGKLLPRQTRHFSARNRTPIGVGVGGRRGRVVNA